LSLVAADVFAQSTDPRRCPHSGLVQPSTMWNPRTCLNAKSNTQVQALLWLLRMSHQRSMYPGIVLHIYIVKLSTRWMSRNPHPKNSILRMEASVQGWVFA